MTHCETRRSASILVLGRAVYLALGRLWEYQEVLCLAGLDMVGCLTRTRTVWACNLMECSRLARCPASTSTNNTQDNNSNRTLEPPRSLRPACRIPRRGVSLAPSPGLRRRIIAQAAVLPMAWSLRSHRRLRPFHRRRLSNQPLASTSNSHRNSSTNNSLSTSAVRRYRCSFERDTHNSNK